MFDWDPEKARTNLSKHKVSFEEAGSVFSDPMAYSFPDPDHSNEEDRTITIGYSLSNRMLIVSHSDSEEVTRIISARPVTKGESLIYEEE